MNDFIALAKGELGKQIEDYMGNYGMSVKLDGRPLTFEQRAGNCLFRPMQSKDVPWYVAERGAYGITGEDLVAEYMIGNSGRIKIIQRLGFGKADLVLFAKENENIPQMPKVAVPYYYRNIARKFLPEYDIVEVSGSTEGFVIDSTTDIGLDITTYLLKPESERSRTTLAANGLRIVEKIMSTEAVVISENRSRYTLGDFERMLRGNASN
ncbi:MAG: ATP phosphoribosyltransferase [Candidatus Aenigmarchaeota archaeon]|nr:ATP phosphoribosyltransferase [Candidatus Aenigmarchaeota archaeon]